jgi:hypothetical protein
MIGEITQFADSLKCAADSLQQTNLDFSSSFDTFLQDNTYVHIPVLLILNVSVNKYFLGNKFSETSFLEFFLEIPVDLGFLSISLVITYLFVRVSDVQFGILITLMCLFVGMLSALLRRTAMYEFEKEDSNVVKIGLIGLPNLLLSVFFVAYIITLI